MKADLLKEQLEKEMLSNTENQNTATAGKKKKGAKK